MRYGWKRRGQLRRMRIASSAGRAPAASTSIASRPKLARICLALQVFLIHFALERGYVAENVTGREAGEHDIAPTPFAQHAADIFPRHAGHRRQIGEADLLVEHDALRAGRLSEEFRQVEQRAGHARLN